MKSRLGFLAALCCTVLLTLPEGYAHGDETAAATFTNPLMDSGPDPYAIFHDGYYYYIGSGRGGILLRKTKDISDLRNAPVKTIWAPPPGKDYSRDIWAPELHFMDGKWYVYVAADDGRSDHHHLYVIENASPDPMQGEFVLKGRLKTDINDNWAIDGTVFENKGTWYIVWSGWPIRRITAETACIWIARLKNPWTIDSQRVMLSQPEFDWERHCRNPQEYNNPGPTYEVYVNEGPAALKKGNKIFIAYSASGCWTPYYCLGLLTADADGDLLDPASWKKSPQPVFQQSIENKVYGTGHNSFIKSPDGTEDWILYHASDQPNECGGGRRSPRIQKITWKADGTPDFDVPLPVTEKIVKPSGIQ